MRVTFNGGYTPEPMGIREIHFYCAEPGCTNAVRVNELAPPNPAEVARSLGWLIASTNTGLGPLCPNHNTCITVT